MKVKRFVGGNLASNGYVIYQQRGGDCFVIDPGYEPGVFLRYVEEEELRPIGIILTHLHHDHVGASQTLRDRWDCPIYMHEADAIVYKGPVDIMVKDGNLLSLEGEELKIISTPGHTKGSISIMCEKSRICFTGDTIFDTDLGRSDLEGGSEKDMEDTVRNIISKWDKDILIYPGHDDGCTMKAVHQYNSEYIAIMDGKGRL